MAYGYNLNKPLPFQLKFVIGL